MSAGLPIGNVELALEYGGDFTLDEQGNLALVIDTYDDPAATRQRITLLVMTNPTLYDNSGTPIARPDDLFNPSWGAGLRLAVGQDITPTLTSAISARIIAALANDPGIATSPAPIVTVVDEGGGLMLVSVACDSIVGQSVTVNNIPLRVFGG